MKEIISQYTNLRRQGATPYIPSVLAPRQVRMDIQPSGVSLVYYDLARSTVGKTLFQKTATPSMREAGRLAHVMLTESRLLKPGVALLVDFNADTNNCSQYSLQSGENVATTDQLGGLARSMPSKIKNLVNPADEGTTLHHVICTSGTNKVMIGSLQCGDFINTVEPKLPRGAVLRRFMGQISALDYLQQNETCKQVFGNETLVCLLESSLIYYFSLKRDDLVGMTTTPRTNTLKPLTLRDRAQNMGLSSKYNILIVYLTGSHSDSEETGAAVRKEITDGSESDLGVLTPPELIKEDPRLSTFQDAEILPLGLFRNMK
jgi:hypothetical protein